MEFKTVAEAYNHYRTMTIQDLETRAQEISGTIETDPNVDIKALNIELTAIKEAKEDIQGAEGRGAGAPKGLRALGSLGMGAVKRSFDPETVIDTPEYRSAFYKSLLGQSMTEAETEAFKVGVQSAEKRADAFNSTSDSLAVLPTETLNEIISKARTIGGLMGECRAFNMPTKISIPVATPGTAAAWHVEGATVETDKASLASVTFDGFEIMKIISISAKVRRMSISAFEAYLVDELTACVMETIADALVNGSGSSQGTGIETITWTASGETQNAVEIAASGTGSNFTYAKVVETVALLKRGYAAGAKWVMNNATLYNVFYGMTDNNGRPIFVADPKAESIGKILGFEVIIDDHMAANCAILGNFAKYLAYNMPEGIAIETSRDSGFRKGVIDYRALAVADCKPIVSDAFVKLYKASA